MKTALFFSAMTALSLFAADASYRISFDGNTEATADGGTVRARQKGNVEFVPGIKGRAAALDTEVSLEYDASKLLPSGNGTISLWFKIDWEPYGTGSFKDRDLLKNGNWGPGYGSDQCHHLMSIKGKRGLFLPLEQDTIGEKNVTVTRRMMRGDWNHLTIVMRKERQPEYYYNGTFNGHWFHSPDKHILEPKLIVFGGKTRLLQNIISGLNGAVDEFEAFDKPFTPEEVLVHHAQFMPVEKELLDYAAIVGEKKELRLNLINISGKKVTETHTLTILGPDGQTISSQKIQVLLQPGEKKRFPVSFAPKVPGLHKLVWNPDTPRRQTAEIYALENRTIASVMPENTPIRRNLICEIDCTKNYPADTCLENFPTRVIKGKYRESTSVEPAAGFAYRIRGIRNPGKPHWLEIEYPDDAGRAYFVGVYNFVWNRLNTVTLNNLGIVTGEDRPLTGKILTKRMLFWPDGREVAVSVQQFLTYPNQKGPAAAKIRLYEQEGELPKLPEAKNSRKIGVWQEDPGFTGTLWFKCNAEARVANLDFWHEKISRIIRYQKFMGINEWCIQVMEYHNDKTGMPFSAASGCNSGGGYCPGWDSLWVAMLEREKLSFYIRLNQREFSPRFREGSVIGRKIGEEYFAKDWADYVSRGKEAVELLPWNAEKNTASLSAAKYVNPIHPRVVAAFKSIISAYIDKYGSSPSFQGIHLNDCIETGFHGMEYGYDDWTVSEFEKDTGIRVPADKRYRFLTAPSRINTWRQWRCGRIAKVVAEYAALCKDRQLVYQIQGNRYKKVFDANPDGNANSALLDLGIDVAAIAKIPNVKILQGIRPMYSFVERQNSNEDYFLLSDSFARMFGKDRISALNVVYIANMEVYMRDRKDIPMQKWFPAGPHGGNNATTHTYATALPTNDWVMEPYSHALAAYDCQDLYHGFWGSTENGAVEEFRDFFRAMRAIPEGDYKLIPGANDPVAVRVSGKNYYLVNRSHLPATVDCLLNGKKKQFKLGPNGLASGTCGRYAVFSNLTVKLPEVGVQELKARIARLGKMRTPDTAADVSRLEKAFQEGRFFRAETLFRLRKIRFIARKPPVDLRWFFDWKEEIFSVIIRNYSEKNVSGNVLLKKIPKGWTMDRNSGTFNLPAGKTGRVEIPLTANGYLPCADFSLEAVINGIPYQFPRILIRGLFANYGADRTNQFWSAMTRRGNMTDGKEKENIPENFVPRIAWYWTEAGIGLYVDVPKREFIAPGKQGAMFLADSLQIYFDQKNNAETNTPCYDGDDTVFQVGLLNGKPEVWCEQGLTPGVVDTPVDIRVSAGMVSYHVFFRKELLPEFTVGANTSIGAALLINAVFRNANGKFEVRYAYNRTNPYRTPGAWMDLYLGKDMPSSLLVRVTGKNLTPEKPPAGKGGVTGQGDILNFSSERMTGRKRPYTFRFTPKEDGVVSMTFSGQYNNPGCTAKNYVRLCKIKLEGAELKDGALETLRGGTGSVWKLHPRDRGASTPDGYIVNFWNGIQQGGIAVRKNIPVTITVEASLPESIK